VDDGTVDRDEPFPSLSAHRAVHDHRTSAALDPNLDEALSALPLAGADLAHDPPQQRVRGLTVQPGGIVATL
jgi:hypothetical protein